MQNILIFPPIYDIKRSKFDDEMKKKKSHDFRKVKFSPILWTMHKYTNQIIKKKKQNKYIRQHIISHRTGSLTSRGSDESKSRRVFSSLLRRHTSFGGPDSNARVYTTTHSSVSTLSHDSDMK